jgi:probable F420-dependent oxidoreductase
MTSSNVVDAGRRALGRVGAFLPISTTVAPSVGRQRDAVRRLERAGYRAAWTNEGVGGKDAFVQLALLLAATEQMAFGTGISNIWARSPQTAQAAAAQLTEAYPGRFVLGLGVGYPEQAAGAGRDFGRPLATMRDYLDRMGAPTQMPAPDVHYPRIVAANGPKMLALAAELADGAIPAMQPPESTAQARQILGPNKLLVVLTRATTEPGEIAELVAGVREHLAAGADHVMVMTTGTDFAGGVDQLAQLAPALAELNS